MTDVRPAAEPAPPPEAESEPAPPEPQSPPKTELPPEPEPIRIDPYSIAQTGGISDDLEREIEEALSGVSLNQATLDQMLAGQDFDAIEQDLEPESRVKGTVVKIHHDDVFFSLGARNEGVASLRAVRQAAGSRRSVGSDRLAIQRRRRPVRGHRARRDHRRGRLVRPDRGGWSSRPPSPATTRAGWNAR